MINYIKGDLFQHIPENEYNPIMIPQVCNNIGGWGSGFVVALSKKWKEPEHYYRVWHSSTVIERFNKHRKFELGQVDYVKISDIKTNVVFVANMIGQNGCVNKDNPKPIRYASLLKCMEDVAGTIRGLNKFLTNKTGKETNMKIYAPKFGSGLAQGKWELIEELINEVWKDIPVTIFEI